MMESREAPVDPGSLSIDAFLSALLDVVLQEGEPEMKRAKGHRGTLRLSVEVELGDRGTMLNAKHSLVFERFRHAKDGFR